ncbi:hypothetical protein [Myroides sp. WP-1]|uniref:hypothetical protein n=1 Tax=Myroides sp. WP-1 TaxID=2759944 RepID=UPI0015F9F3C9|nr:hypothetical protein [Myroides sp. WP-1]MBB1138895.1 hypothetical protein [Myroides sp. WP-1]
MDQLKQTIQRIKNEGYNIQPFLVMREAAFYYKKTILLVVVSLLLSFFFVSFLGSIALTQLTDINESATPAEIQEQVIELTNQLSQPPLLYTYLISAVIFSALSSILIAGFYKINAEAALGKTPRFISVFKYFFSIRGLYVFIAQGIITLFFTVFSVLLKEYQLEMVSIIINWLVNILTLFVTPLIIFGRMSPFAAIKTSIQVVNKQPIPIILTVILNYFLVFSGLFFFLIGIVITLPYLFSIYFTLYKQIIGYNLEEAKVQ